MPRFTPEEFYFFPVPSLVPARVRDALRVVSRFSSLPSRVIPFTCGRAGWGVGRLGGLGVGDWAGGKDGSASDTSESKKQNERRFPADPRRAPADAADLALPPRSSAQLSGVKTRIGEKETQNTRSRGDETAQERWRKRDREGEQRGNGAQRVTDAHKTDFPSLS